MGKIKKRAGFTLIEVIVALGIFMIVVLALLSSYYSYYRAVKDLRYKSIGQNLVELQMEDIRNLATSILDILIDDKNFQYPEPENPPQEFLDSVKPEDQTRLKAPNYPKNMSPSPNTYDSGIIDGSYVISRLTNVCGAPTDDSLENEQVLLDQAVLSGTLMLPENMVFVPTKHTDPYDYTVYYDYTLYLYKETFPSYEKQIQITRKEGASGKIYEFTITIFWENRTKSLSIKGVKWE